MSQGASNPIRNSLSTLLAGPNYIGLATVDIGTNNKVSLVGNATLSDSKGYIGLATTTPGSAWPDPKAYIGLVTATMAGSVNTGMTTLFPGPNYIGLATVDIGTNNKVGILGNVSISGAISLVSGYPISGIVTVAGLPAWPDPKAYIGLVTATLAGSVNTGMTTLFPGPNYIGLATVDIGTNNKIALIGNVSISGAISLISGYAMTGNITANTVAWSDPKTYIGLVTATLAGSVNTGMTTLFPGPNYIGLATIDIGTNNKVALIGNISISGAVSLVSGYPITGIVTIANPVSSVGVIGNISISGAISLVSGYPITGIVTVTGQLAWPDPKTFIGLATVTIGAGGAGFQTVFQGSPPWTNSIVGNVTLSDSKTFIGLVTIGGISTLTLADPKGFIGLVTIGGISTLTLADPKGFIGLVTAVTRNAGTLKTLVTLPITLSTSSQLTVVVPTNANVIYLTNLVMSSDATVRMSIKSGVTYLTGNASIGITLAPLGGFVQAGAPDSPVFIGCPSGALVIEKFDITGTKANVGGNITYFQE